MECNGIYGFSRQDHHLCGAALAADADGFRREHGAYEPAEGRHLLYGALPSALRGPRVALLLRQVAGMLAKARFKCGN